MEIPLAILSDFLYFLTTEQLMVAFGVFARAIYVWKIFFPLVFNIILVQFHGEGSAYSDKNNTFWRSVYKNGYCVVTNFVLCSIVEDFGVLFLIKFSILITLFIIIFLSTDSKG